VGSYVVSEFSEYLVRGGRDPRKIFDAINKHFGNSNSNNKNKAKAKAMMLNAFAKLAIKYEPLKEDVRMICHLCSEHWDPEVQQRGV
jgi:AP-2 complex subunit alpha